MINIVSLFNALFMQFSKRSFFFSVFRRKNIRKSINNIYDIQMGTTNICTPNQRHQMFRIKTVIIHPNYLDVLQTDFSGDIAILSTYVNLSGYQPICLPTNGMHFSISID